MKRFIYTNAVDVISPHSIAIPKSSYLTAVVFLSSFFFIFQRLISKVTERNSTRLGYIFTYDCYLQKMVRTFAGIYLLRVGGKKPLLGTHFELRPNITYLCIGTRYQQSETNLSIYRDSPACPKFGELWSRYGWERLASYCRPPQFSHW